MLTYQIFFPVRHFRDVSFKVSVNNYWSWHNYVQSTACQFVSQFKLQSPVKWRLEVLSFLYNKFDCQMKTNFTFFFKAKRPLASFSVVAEVWVKPHPWKFLLMARDAPKRTIHSLCHLGISAFLEHHCKRIAIISQL